MLKAASSKSRWLSAIAKTEKQKMLAGELYDYLDPELNKEKEIVRDLVYEFNTSHPREVEKRKKLLKEIFQTENNFNFEPPIHVDYGKYIKIGNNSFFNFNTTILDACPVEIGEHVLVAPNCTIASAAHPTDIETRKKCLDCALPVKIGNNVWLGAGVIVCPGVSIGDNSIIGAGSVVVKDIPPNVIAVGNPAKPVKKVPADPKERELLKKKSL